MLTSYSMYFISDISFETLFKYINLVLGSINFKTAYQKILTFYSQSVHKCEPIPISCKYFYDIRRKSVSVFQSVKDSNKGCIKQTSKLKKPLQNQPDLSHLNVFRYKQFPLYFIDIKRYFVLDI